MAKIETEETLKMVDNFSIRVEKLSLDYLMELTLKAKQEWYDIHPRYKKNYVAFYDDCEVDDDEFEYYEIMDYDCDICGHFEIEFLENDVYNAPKEVIDRWIVNYIRHKLTDYEKELEKINGRYGEIEAREKYRYLLAEQMKKTYPELIKAIEINMLNSTSNIVE